MSVGQLLGTHDCFGNPIGEDRVSSESREDPVGIGPDFLANQRYDLTPEAFGYAVAELRSLAEAPCDVRRGRDPTLGLHKSRLMMRVAQFPVSEEALAELRDRRDIVAYASRVRSIVYFAEERRVAMSGSGGLGISDDRSFDEREAYLDF